MLLEYLLYDDITP